MKSKTAELTSKELADFGDVIEAAYIFITSVICEFDDDPPTLDWLCKRAKKVRRKIVEVLSSENEMEE
jgi:hypothetical protein